MAKSTGLGNLLFVSGYDLSGDIGSLERIGGGPAAMDVTGINQSAFNRIGGLRDGAIDFTAWFNPATNQAHDRLENLPTADVVVTWFAGSAIGNEAASCVAKQIDYPGTRAADGAFSFPINTQANGFGVEFGDQLTAGKRTDTTATNGTGLDFGASSTFGLQAYLHVFAFTGTSVTVTIQESSDDAVGDPYANVTGGSFTAATGITSERIATSGSLTVERWLRVVTTGTFSNAVFAVQVTRNLTATVF